MSPARIPGASPAGGASAAAHVQLPEAPPQGVSGHCSTNYLEIIDIK